MKMVEMDIVRYRLSKDKRGLIAYFEDKSNFHIHSDEMDKLQKWIHKLLRGKKK